jgi:hypothetical protein
MGGFHSLVQTIATECRMNPVQRVCRTRRGRDISFMCMWHRRAGETSVATRLGISADTGRRIITMVRMTDERVSYHEEDRGLEARVEGATHRVIGPWHPVEALLVDSEARTLAMDAPVRSTRTFSFSCADYRSTMPNFTQGSDLVLFTMPLMSCCMLRYTPIDDAWTYTECGVCPDDAQCVATALEMERLLCTQGRPHKRYSIIWATDRILRVTYAIAHDATLRKWVSMPALPAFNAVSFGFVNGDDAGITVCAVAAGVPPGEAPAAVARIRLVDGRCEPSWQTCALDVGRFCGPGVVRGAAVWDSGKLYLGRVKQQQHTRTSTDRSRLPAVVWDFRRWTDVQDDEATQYMRQLQCGNGE